MMSMFNILNMGNHFKVNKMMLVLIAVLIVIAFCKSIQESESSPSLSA